MDRVEHLPELDEVAIVGVIAGTSPVIAIGELGALATEQKAMLIAADLDVPQRIARVQRELRRRLAELARDQEAIDADPFEPASTAAPAC